MRTLLVCLLLAFCLPGHLHAQSTYYLSPYGNDANDGTSFQSAWLSPHHSLRCGDVILAAPGNNYSYRNFDTERWGEVSCPQNNNVAWLKCATFDACKITTPAGVQAFGISVGASYWGVQGWEVSVRGGVANGLSCFNAIPPDHGRSIHHIIFANNVANVCDLAGFGAGSVYEAGASVDYVAFIGNVSYEAGTSNTNCGSGIGIFQPVASDHNEGTHIYVAGNISYNSKNPATGGCFDGNGISFDTFDGHSSLPVSYGEQSVIDNNISFSNDGVGVRVEYNNAGPGPTHAPIFVRHNTVWGNSKGVYQYGSPDCGEILLHRTVKTMVFLNLAETNQPGCYSDEWNPNPALNAQMVDSSSQILYNWANSNSGSNLQSSFTTDFSFGPNILGVEPWLADPYTPGAPECSGTADVPSCMANVISHFMPRYHVATPFGYQWPSRTPVYDSLFPQWLCNVNLPPGLVTMGCSAAGQ